MDVSELTLQELKNLLSNSERYGRSDMLLSVVKEMHRRGKATSAVYRTLKWNQDHVPDVMLPFKEVAAKVSGNKRTSYTQAGGRKIGRPKNDPEKMWVDTYCAIKTKNLNAVFVCYIKSPGDDPEFRLYIDRGPLAAQAINTQSYNADQLTEALAQWRHVAELS